MAVEVRLPIDGDEAKWEPFEGGANLLWKPDVTIERDGAMVIFKAGEEQILAYSQDEIDALNLQLSLRNIPIEFRIVFSTRPGKPQGQ